MGRGKADFKALRELCGLSQQDVADALGVRLTSAKRWENPRTENGWYEPPEDAWAYLDSMRELMESQADFICERAIDLRDATGVTEAEVTYYRGQAEFDASSTSGGPVGFVNATARLAGLYLESEGFEVRFVYPRREG